MSRTGHKPVAIPDKVSVQTQGNLLSFQGPKGKSTYTVHSDIEVKVEAGQIHLKRSNNDKRQKELHGLSRAMVVNEIKGVSEGFSKSLDIEGVGFRAELKGKQVAFSLGFSHPVEFPIPEGVTVAIEKQTKLVVSGSSRALVGQTAAKIRDLRSVEPYKGKGIRYTNEIVQRKQGKAAGGK